MKYVESHYVFGLNPILPVTFYTQKTIHTNDDVWIVYRFYETC